MRWWERWPDRLTAELKALDEAGISYERNEAAFAKGIVELRLNYLVGGEYLELTATYPDFYPFVKFEVRAPSLSLSRHQHPFGKTLCLIGRSTWKWHTTDTLADFLANQVPRVLTAARAAPEVAAAMEEPQGEPYTEYYPYTVPATIIVDSSWTLDPGVRGGLLDLRLSFETAVQNGEVLPIARGAVAQVRPTAGEALARGDPAVLDAFPEHFPGRWVRLDQPIREHEPMKVLEAVSALQVGQRWKSQAGKQVT
jgi:hypothetical protein